MSQWTLGLLASAEHPARGARGIPRAGGKRYTGHGHNSVGRDDTRHFSSHRDVIIEALAVYFDERHCRTNNGWRISCFLCVSSFQFPYVVAFLVTADACKVLFDRLDLPVLHDQRLLSHDYLFVVVAHEVELAVSHHLTHL